jgi:hypothetical protein
MTRLERCVKTGSNHLLNALHATCRASPSSAPPPSSIPPPSGRQVGARQQARAGASRGGATHPRGSGPRQPSKPQPVERPRLTLGAPVLRHSRGSGWTAVVVFFVVLHQVEDVGLARVGGGSKTQNAQVGSQQARQEFSLTVLLTAHWAAAAAAAAAEAAAAEAAAAAVPCHPCCSPLPALSPFPRKHAPAPLSKLHRRCHRRCSARPPLPRPQPASGRRCWRRAGRRQGSAGRRHPTTGRRLRVAPSHARSPPVLSAPPPRTPCRVGVLATGRCWSALDNPLKEGVGSPTREFLLPPPFPRTCNRSSRAAP